MADFRPCVLKTGILFTQLSFCILFFSNCTITESESSGSYYQQPAELNNPAAETVPEEPVPPLSPWQADEIAVKYVRNMQAVMIEFTDGGIGDYKQLAQQLMAELAPLRANTAMTGESLEAINSWLNTVEREVEHLVSPDAELSASAITRINHQLAFFDRYFK